ncbi:uncharacterized protein METZ01_LOCUS434618, partial [marine metagenome]
MAFINHCGASLISLDRLGELNDPVPYTNTHYPIRHDVFVNMAKDAITKGGFEIKSEEYSLLQVDDGKTKKDNMFGLLKVQSRREVMKDTGKVVGLRNSGSMDFRGVLGCGGECFVCDNLVFSAEIIVGRKHTKNIMVDLPGLMTAAVERL